MQTKLQELTEKIYTEGVEKARSEADKILDRAKKEAANIEKDAKNRADLILKEAENKADTLHKHVESELKMTIKQAVTALKQDLTTLVTLKALNPTLKKTFNDTDFMKELIRKVVSGWMEKDHTDLHIILPEKDRTEFEAFFKTQLDGVLTQGFELEFSDRLNSGFKVGPSGESYQISFTDQDFIEFLKSYLRPKTAELLFEDSK